MTAVMEPAPPPRAKADLVESIRDVLRLSPEPLTLPRIRTALAARQIRVRLEELAQALERQVAAQVIYRYPKYRSGNDRYWHRPLREHVAQLLRRTLANGLRSVAELRRGLPDYAKILAEPILEDELAQGRIFAHPPLHPRNGVCYGLMPASPAPYLQKELEGIYERMDRLGFLPAQIRQSLLALLQTEAEWTSARIALPRPVPRSKPASADHQQTLIPDTMF